MVILWIEIFKKIACMAIILCSKTRRARVIVGKSQRQKLILATFDKIINGPIVHDAEAVLAALYRLHFKSINLDEMTYGTHTGGGGICKHLRRCRGKRKYM
jgi:hypothetical protein